MTGRSLLDLLKSTNSGIVEPDRDAVYTGRERHAWCRIDGKGYPARMIRTRDFLYIRNYEPDRWPAGNYRIITNEGHYGDIDASPTKDVMMRMPSSPLYRLAFGKRPEEELYDCRKDSAQIHNLANAPSHQELKQELAVRLTEHLKESGDPRATGTATQWDDWPYYGRNNWKLEPTEVER